MKRYGSIDFKKQQESGLSIIEWLFMEQVHFMSASKKARAMNGWVMVNAKETGEFMGVSDRTIRNHMRFLIDNGWIDQDEVTKMIRCSEKWVDINTVSVAKKEDEKEPETHRKNFPDTENNSGDIFPTSENFSTNSENFSTPIHYEKEERENKETPTPYVAGSAPKSKTKSLVIRETSIDHSIIHSFIDHRKSMKKPMTQHALDLFISKLEETHRNGYDISRAINDAIINGWQSIYPEKQSRTQQQNTGYGKHTEANMSAAERFKQRHSGGTYAQS